MQEVRSFTQVGGKRIEVTSRDVHGIRVYSAWEPTARSHGSYRHYQVLTGDGPDQGRIGTARFFSRTPLGPVRAAELEAHEAAQYRRAYAAICHAFPELAGRPDLRLRWGEIEIQAADSTKVPMLGSR